MTHYNKKTYRIDDIDEDRTPKSSFFSKKDDKEITFADYYRTRYGITIQNMQQRLLVSRPSRRDLNRGDSKPIYLVPELCGMTGLDFTDDKKYITFLIFQSFHWLYFNINYFLINTQIQ